MAVPAAISRAFTAYLEAMDEARKGRRRIDGLLGLGGGAGSERCQDDFVSQLNAAVADFAAEGPSSAEAAEALRFVLSQAHEHRKSKEAYWMLLASHTLALPLIDLLEPADARAVLEYYEAEYPKRERLPAQKTAIKRLAERANS